MIRFPPQFRAVLCTGVIVLGAAAPAAAQVGEDPAAFSGLGLEGSLLTPLTPSTGSHGQSVPRDDQVARFALTLRGQYTISGENREFTVSAIPQAEIRYSDARLDVEAGASVEFAHDFSDDPRFVALDVAGEAGYALDRTTRVSAEGTVRLEQEDARSSRALPTGPMTAPLAFTGDLGVSVTHTMGSAGVTLMAGAAHETMTDADIPSRQEDARTDATLGLRLGQELAPALVGFVAGEVTRSVYETAEADAWHYAASAGLATQWRQFSGEIQAGSGWRDFDAPDLTDTQNLFFAASLAYLPTANLSLRAGYTSNVLPFVDTESGRDARQQSVALEAVYEASSWLGLSADASYLWELDADGGFAYERYTAGLGADVTWFPHATISAGYSFSATNPAPVTGGNEHRLMLGVTLLR